MEGLRHWLKDKSKMSPSQNGILTVPEFLLSIPNKTENQDTFRWTTLYIFKFINSELYPLQKEYSL